MADFFHFRHGHPLFAFRVRPTAPSRITALQAPLNGWDKALQGNGEMVQADSGR